MSDPNSARRRHGFRALIGYEPTVWREGYGEVVLALEPRHMNSLRIAHGGIYATLLDVAMGHAVAYCTVPGNVRFLTTISLTTTYVKSAKGGVITAFGHLQTVEGRVATCSGEVRDQEGAVLALGQATFLYFPGSERPEGVPPQA